jgi:nitrogen fixation/metabolism regulation signal transduction histidine kinase
MTARAKKRRLGLQWKVTLALVVLVMTPLGAAAVLIDQIATVAANFASNDVAHHIEPMEKAAARYRDLVFVTKRLQSEIATNLAKRPDLLAMDPNKIDLDKLLEPAEPDLYGIAVVRGDGSTVVEASRALPGPEWRTQIVDQSLGATGGSLRLTFAVPATLPDELGALDQALKTARVSSAFRGGLRGGYARSFLVVMVLAAVAAIIVGFVMAGFVTRRVDALVSTARKVSDGKVEARVSLKGGDEMAELGSAFDTMLDDLAESRGQIEYLQRIGAWQDVARRLAHEIKNPLTPIQLAVQQCVSAYKGDDARFAKTLQDTGEIVEEEIEGLRRLVDTFRTLGQLPKVEKAPLALAEVIEELRLDPTYAQKLGLQPPAEPVTVRADKLLLKRVLANLVENGVHAGAEAGGAGTVVVSWRADAGGDYVRIMVDDQGKGVAEADRAKIFEPYVTTKATGTGLGLAIAKKIALEHGGDLELAKDKAPTGGARFVVSLPLRGPEASLA